MLGIKEIRRSKVKFALLTSVIALISFLMIFLTALSLGLITSVTGALNGLQTDLLVYSQESRGNLQVSRISPEQQRSIAAVPGVAATAPVGTTTVSTDTQLSSAGNALQIISLPEPGGTGEPRGLVAGELPNAANEVAIDATKIPIGSTIQVVNGPSLTVVGLMKGAQFSAQPTGYTTFDTYAQTFVQTTGAKSAPTNAIAVQAASGSDPDQLASQIDTSVPDTQTFTPSAAADAIPGAQSIAQTFSLLILLALICGVVVIGFFFLILTAQKIRMLTVLRALGSSTIRLAGVLALQITVVVIVGTAIGAILAAGALAGASAAIPVTITAPMVLGCVFGLLVGGYVAGLTSIRRIAKIEPASAVNGGAQ